MTAKNLKAAPPDPSGARHKTSYSISCSSAFRDRVLATAARRGVNAADLARAVILTVPPDAIRAAEDPGGPGPEDREAVALRSGPSKGKVWRRKPRLQVRLPKGYTPVLLRKALGLALRLDGGDLRLALENAMAPTRDEETARLRAQVGRLRAALAAASGDPLDHPVRTRNEALFVLGFPPGARPSAEAVKSRFRQFAVIHHPDSETGDTQRMAALNQAMSFMRGSMKN